MQDLLSLLVCSNEKTGLQVGIWYKIIFWHELCETLSNSACLFCGWQEAYQWKFSCLVLKSTNGGATIWKKLKLKQNLNNQPRFNTTARAASRTVSKTYMNCSNAYCIFSFWLSATNSKCNFEMCMGNVVML